MISFVLASNATTDWLSLRHPRSALVRTHISKQSRRWQHIQKKMLIWWNLAEWRHAYSEAKKYELLVSYNDTEDHKNK